MVSNMPGDTANPIESHMHRLLLSRELPKTICPSEVARALSKEELQSLDLEQWRDAMPLIREQAWNWRTEGKLEILQRGDPIDPSLSPENVSGPIRLRRTDELKS
jgi:hypothetical protein